MAAGRVSQRTYTAIDNPPSKIRSTTTYSDEQTTKVVAVVQTYLSTAQLAAIKSTAANGW